MSLKKYTDQEYYSQFEGGAAPDDFDGLGSYQFVKLQDIIDNFMITYTGDDAVLGNVGRHVALFHAQRAVAELSYDVARPIKSFEYELVGSLILPLPKDYISLNGVFVLDDNGVKHWLRERKESGNPTSPLQDQDGNYLYTQEGDILENSQNSETNERYVAASREQDANELSNYYGLGSAYFTTEYGGWGFTGKRYGLKPEFANTVGTYVLDDNKGTLLFDNKVSDKIIVVDYVTDGLDDDIENIKIHKFLEDAVYNYMLFKIAKGKANVTGQDKAMFEKEFYTSKRRGKLRLTNINPQELLPILRNKSQWLKF